MLHKDKGFKVFIILILSLFLSIYFVHPAEAEDTDIKITLEEGFSGKVKRGKGFPLKLKLENNGEAFSGDLLINFHPSYNTGGAAAIRVELPAGSTKNYQVSLPGMTEDHPTFYQNEPSIFLYKGEWKNGEKVSFKGEKTIKPKFIDANESVLGVLSENYDRLKELRILPSTSIQMLQMKKEELPKQSTGLEMIDYLLIDEFAVSQLDEAQQKAIKEWVKAGGVLVAGGAPNASQSYGLLYSLLPMKMENETSRSTGFLQGINKEKPSFQELKLFAGQVEKGSSVIAKSGDLPVTVKKTYGDGTILQTAFSLGDEPLSSWKGYSTWFDRFLTHADRVSSAAGNYGPDYLDQLYWEFAEVNEFFPASNFSIGQLIGLLAGYIIVIVPVLYFVLRKMDKREHFWWIIPTLAFLMAAAVFGLGAKDRISQPQLNQMGVYKVNNNHLTGLQAATLLSNKSGEYTLSMPKGEFNAVMSTNSISGTDPLRGGIFEERVKRNEIVFPAVEYWSSKTIYGKARTETEGSFMTDLTLKSNHLTGTIQNGFEYDFEEIYIWSGNDEIKLGPLKKGETLEVDEQIKQSLLTKPNMKGYGGMYPNQQSDINKMKKEKMEYAASAFLIGDMNQPIIAGITKNAIIDISMEGKKEKQNNLNLILEPFEAKNEFSGPFTLIDEMLGTSWKIINGLIHEKEFGSSNNEVMIEDGEYEYTLQFPKQLTEKTMKLEEISIRINSQLVQYWVMNHDTGEWSPIPPDQRSFKLDSTNNIKQYVSKEGELLLKLNKNAKGDPYVQLPAITIKGEVAQ